MNNKTLSIIIDTYRHSCITLEKNTDDGFCVTEHLDSTYGLSWLNTCELWRALRKGKYRLDADLITTNSHFIQECLCANIFNKDPDYQKKFEVSLLNTSDNDTKIFLENVEKLSKYLPKDCVIPRKEIAVFVSNECRAPWDLFLKVVSPFLQGVYTDIVETEDVEKAEFILITQEETEKYVDKNYSICFAAGRNDGIFIADNCLLWNTSMEKVSILLYRYFEFFHIRQRFINICEICLKDSELNDIKEAQDLIAMWQVADTGFNDAAMLQNNGNNFADNKLLLLDNAVVSEVSLGQTAQFDKYFFDGNSWKKTDQFCIAIPQDYEINKVYSFDARERNVFIFNSQRHLSASRWSENVKLQVKVIGDGTAGDFFICADGRKCSGICEYPVDSLSRLSVHIKNNRDYDENVNPLICTLNGKVCTAVGSPTRNREEVVYRFEMPCSEIGEFTFTAKIGNDSKHQRYNVLPHPDTVLSRLKPVLQRDRGNIIAVEYEKRKFLNCRKSVKKIVCFVDTAFKVEGAVFYEDICKEMAEEDIFAGRYFCWDKRYFLEAVSGAQLCEVSGNGIKLLKTGKCVLRITSMDKAEIYQDINFEVVSDKSALFEKLLLGGLVTSIVAAFWYGAGFFALIFKLLCPLLVYYADAHSRECIKTLRNKIVFWFALLISFFVLFLGVFQELK